MIKDQSISKTELVWSIDHSPSHEGIPVICILHILLRWSLSRDLSQRSLTEFQFGNENFRNFIKELNCEFGDNILMEVNGWWQSTKQTGQSHRIKRREFFFVLLVSTLLNPCYLQSQLYHHQCENSIPSATIILGHIFQSMKFRND